MNKIENYTLPEGRSLGLKVVWANGRPEYKDAPKDFRWNLELGGETVAPDWDPIHYWGGGLYIWAWAQGYLDASEIWHKSDVVWLAVEFDTEPTMYLYGCYKVPKCRVVATSPYREEVLGFVLSHTPEDKRAPLLFDVMVAKNAEVGYGGVGKSLDEYGNTIAGTKGTAIAGDYGTAKAGYEGTAIAGAGGTAIAGDKGTAKAGAFGKAEAGDGGTAHVRGHGNAIAGDFGRAFVDGRGIAIAGDYGVAKAGDEATAGYKGIAAVGPGGQACVGRFGRARAGIGGAILFQHENKKFFVRQDGIQSQQESKEPLACDGGIKPDTFYILDVSGVLMEDPWLKGSIL